MGKDHASAWDDFWADNVDSDGGGCLPAGWQGIDAVQQSAWVEFAEGLPQKARLLDVATGDGRVLGWIAESRGDLKLTGCDLAQELPTPPTKAKIHTSVAMEDLPFRDDFFSAAVSQFGFEYGDTEKAAREIARVVEPDGAIAFMTHRADGPILAHNLARREQIAWVVEEQDLFAIAKRSLALRGTGIAIFPPKIASAPLEGAQRFGARSAAWEISEAIRQTLMMGQRDLPANVARTLDTIALKAKNELGRIASLEAACNTTKDEIAFLAACTAGGLQQVSSTPLREGPDVAPFADFRVFRHAD